MFYRKRIKFLFFLYVYVMFFLPFEKQAFCNNLKKINVKSPSSYHAIIEIIEFSSKGRKIVTIKEEWFKEPNMIRREIFTPGIISKKVFIYDGKKSYTYFPLVGEQIVYEETFDYTPSFYIYKLSEKTLKLLHTHKPKLEEKLDRLNDHDVYVVSDQITENDQIITLKIWIERDTFLIRKWEKKLSDSQGEILSQESCNFIDYNIKIPDTFFKAPPRYNIVKRETSFKTPVVPKVSYGKLTAEKLKLILSQEKQLNEIISKYPDCAEAYAQLGNLILLRKEYKKAIHLLTKSLELNPNQKNVYINLSEIYFIIGDMNKSIEFMEKLVGLFPDNAHHYYRLGELYEKAGFIEQAFSAYEKASELQPNDLIHDEGITYHINGIKDKYLESFNRVKKRLGR